MTVESGLMEPEVEGRPLLSLQDLESRLVFTRCKPFVLSSPGRQWIFGGDLTRVEGRSVRPFWALLFTDLLLFAKVSRDRVLFVTEEPLSLLSVSQTFFSIKKKATEFRLLLSSSPVGTDSPAMGGCGRLPDLPLTRTPKKGPRRRTVVLRAPTPELKAVWQNLIQRQIIYLNTDRGGTPASSPLDSPDQLPITAESVATLDTLSLKRQEDDQSSLALDELIEHRCRQLGKAGSNKGSALHLAQWIKGQLGSEPLSPDGENEPEVWSPATLRKRRDQFTSNNVNRFSPRNMSRCEDLEMSEHERSTSRCTEHSTDSQNTVKSTSVTSERPVATVCRQCHQTCLNSADGQLEDVNANCATAVSEFSSLDDACWGPLNFLTSMLSPTDPFNPLPHIAVLPPSPTSHDTSPVDNNPWEDAELSSTIEPTTATQKEGSAERSGGDLEDESDGEAEDPPYQSLTPCGLKRYGTVSSLERLNPEDSDGDETGKEQDDLPPDGVVGGQLETVSQSLRGWTVRASNFMVEKMSLFERLGEDSRATSFFDRYLRSLPDPEELTATSMSLAGEDEYETSGGTSGEDIWGTPTSGDSALTSPTLEHCPDCPDIGTAADDAREQLMMDELLGTVTLLHPMPPSTRTTFPQRRRLEPLPEDEEDTSETSSSPDISECTKSYSTDQGNRSDSCVTSPPNYTFFSRLKLRRSHSAESRSNRASKILQFLRSTKSEDNTPSTSSGGRLMRLFSKDSTDDIPTSIPANRVPSKIPDKTLERRFWKQLRRRRRTITDSGSSRATSMSAS